MHKTLSIFNTKLTHPSSLEKAEKLSIKLFNSARREEFTKCDQAHLCDFLKSCIEIQNDNGMIALVDNTDMPKDARIELIYKPSYAVAVVAIYYSYTYGENEEWLNDFLYKLIAVTFCNGITGHGLEAEATRLAVMEILGAEYVKRYMLEHKSSTLTTSFNKTLSTYREMLHNSKRIIDMLSGHNLTNRIKQVVNTAYVWYAGYGSNIDTERFKCYINGGVCIQNSRFYPGCTDKSDWIAKKCAKFKGEIYFGNSSGSWGAKGVAFFDKDGSDTVPMMLYKITLEQFLEVQRQEGADDDWYGRAVYLGVDEDGDSIYTITSKTRRPKNEPAQIYLELIKTALIENCSYTENEASTYLRNALKN